MTKRKYSINWENDNPISFEVDGITFKSLGAILNEKDRKRLAAMMNNTQADESHNDFNREFNRRFNVPREGFKSPEKIIVSVFTCVAAITLLIAGISSFFNIQKISREKSAPLPALWI